MVVFVVLVGAVSPTLDAQAPQVLGGSGRVFGAPSATSAQLGLVTPNGFGVVDATSDNGTTGTPRTTWTSSITGVVPLASQGRVVGNAVYATAVRQPGFALRYERGVASGAWAGVRAGPARLDSLGDDPWDPVAPSFVLPMPRPVIGGPIGLGGGVWSHRWGVVFGASVTTGTEGYRTPHVSQQWVSASVGGAPDSTVAELVTDTSISSRAVTTWLLKLSAHRTLSRLTLDASGGVLSTPETSRIGWASASAAWRLLSPIAVVVAAGTRGAMLVSPLGGVRERAYATGGLSIGRPVAVRTPRTSDAASSDLRYWLARSDSGYTLEIRARDARQVEVMGDVTDWRAVVCDPVRGDEWRLSTPVMPGVHQLVVRVDGGRWTVPPGASRAVSEFGDVVGVIVAPVRG